MCYRRPWYTNARAAETGVLIRNVDQQRIFSPPWVFTREARDQVADAVRTREADRPATR